MKKINFTYIVLGQTVDLPIYLSWISPRGARGGRGGTWGGLRGHFDAPPFVESIMLWLIDDYL